MATQSNDLLISRDKLRNPEKTLDTFTLFSELPAELRLMIWRAAIIPRRIGIELITSPSTPAQRYPPRQYRLFTPSPILLRINHESRSVGLPHYQVLFTDTHNPAVKKYVDPKLDTIVLYKMKCLSDFPYEMLEDVISSIESLEWRDAEWIDRVRREIYPSLLYPSQSRRSEVHLFMGLFPNWIKYTRPLALRKLAIEGGESGIVGPRGSFLSAIPVEEETDLLRQVFEEMKEEDPELRIPEFVFLEVLYFLFQCGWSGVWLMEGMERDNAEGQSDYVL